MDEALGGDENGIEVVPMSSVMEPSSWVVT